MRQVRRESAHHHAVIIVGIFLRFLQRRDAASAAFVHVGKLGCAAVERSDGSLRSDGHLVRGAVAEIDDLLGMIQRVTGAVLMPRVFGRRREAALHRRGQAAEAEIAAEPAISGAAQLPVPAGNGHPDFDLDLGIGGGHGGGGDAAKRRKILKVGPGRAGERRRSAGGQRELARGNRLRESDGSVRDRERLQAFTRRRGQRQLSECNNDSGVDHKPKYSI